jgi:uncharacterized protein YkwD
MNSKLLRSLTIVLGLSAIVEALNSRGLAQHVQSNQTNQPTRVTTSDSRSEQSKFYAVPQPKPNEESRIFKMTNVLRKQKGKPVFVRNHRLDKAARAHAMNMAKQGIMNHVLDGKRPSDRIKSTVYVFHAYGENIANAWGRPDNTTAMFNFWLKSPPHLANILGPFIHVGIGVVVSESGKYYSCQVFAVPVSAGGPNNPYSEPSNNREKGQNGDGISRPEEKSANIHGNARLSP